MADVDSYGQLVMGNGGIVPLARTDLAEATLEEVYTDSVFVGSNQSAGTFATQSLGSQVVRAAGITAENDVSHAIIRSAGKIKLALPVSGLSSGHMLPGTLPYPKKLVSGDQCMVMANGVSDRETSLSVACSSGEYHVFTVTPSGAAQNEYVSILTGLGIGETLQG